MRRVLLALSVAIVGCKGTSPPVPAGAASAPVDPVVARRDADAQAAYSLDAAVGSIETIQTATRRLAPAAGGDAKEALMDVVDMYDSAGATLADHNEPPPPIEDYRREPSERADERQKTIIDALDALHELRDAQGTLDDLAQTVPSEHKAPLEAIQVGTDEAIESVENAIKGLGGEVPPEQGG